MKTAMLWVPAIAVLSLGAGALLYYLTVPGASDATAPAVAEEAVPPPVAAASSAAGGFSFNAYTEPRVLPDLELMDGEGRRLSLEAFRGKVVLLNIWATWCGPCREEMPTLDRLQAKLGGPDFVVVALSIDREGIAVVKDFYEELGLTSLGMYVDATNRAPAMLKVVGIPATLLIDREGKEIGRVLGPAEWDSPTVVEEIQRYLPSASAGGDSVCSCSAARG